MIIVRNNDIQNEWQYYQTSHEYQADSNALVIMFEVKRDSRNQVHLLETPENEVLYKSIGLHEIIVVMMMMTTICISFFNCV